MALIASVRPREVAFVYAILCTANIAATDSNEIHVAQQSLCSNGILKMHTPLSPSGDVPTRSMVCCPRSCKVCDPPSCRARITGSSLLGGQRGGATSLSCCAEHIVKQTSVCSASKGPPCFMGERERDRALLDAVPRNMPQYLQRANHRASWHPAHKRGSLQLRGRPGPATTASHTSAFGTTVTARTTSGDALPASVNFTDQELGEWDSAGPHVPQGPGPRKRTFDQRASRGRPRPATAGKASTVPEPRQMGKSSEDISFVVFHTESNQVLKSGDKDWGLAEMHMESRKVMGLLKQLFDSARASHPGCRLVLLTDDKTQFDTDYLSPPGPRVQVKRVANLDPGEQMVSRMKARIRFLAAENAESNVVFLDSDMLIVNGLNKVFDQNWKHSPFDLALTWRHDPKMPVNGGIMFVPKSKIFKAKTFLEGMLHITNHAQNATRRWFGTSDQVALAYVMKPEHGYKGTHPGKKTFRTSSIPGAQAEAAYHSVDPLQVLRTRFTLGSITYDVLLLPCPLFNGTAEMKKDRSSQCRPSKDCCTSESYVLHFKGKRKNKMNSYWMASCTLPQTYQCATIKAKCAKYFATRS
ncbi:hypothetical protein CYMTET_28371 [Cymbomonas tetramitiformis]|uniref:Nucleotide-diphospho-sugar transferase domain-containing protein n=1 Tax=Cymbomonas tetramitiformis TaxID=36881 RepID=A0AAE0FMY2_9CHLO|nr:hypothetical protein CYMTET_28371 [Cymbomonas tetramitiformis]